jgi:cytochrome P450
VYIADQALSLGDLELEKDTLITISGAAVHQESFEEGTNFRPDRFEKGSKLKRGELLPLGLDTEFNAERQMTEQLLQTLVTL